MAKVRVGRAVRRAAERRAVAVRERSVALYERTEVLPVRTLKRQALVLARAELARQLATPVHKWRPGWATESFCELSMRVWTGEE